MFNQYTDPLEQRMTTLEEEEQARTLAARYRMQAAYEELTTPAINFLVKTKPLPWESLESLLFRASAQNHLSGISVLERALMLPENGLMSIKRHLQLSIALGQDSNTLSPVIPTLTSKTTIKLYGQTLPIKHVALTTSRVCPRCLDEFGYGKSYWLLALFPICEIHNCQLIDSCPRCEKPLTGARPSYDYCSCGTQYSKINSTECPEPLHEMSKVLAGKFIQQSTNCGTDYFPNDFLSLDLVDMLELLAFLGALSEDPSATYLGLSRRVVSLRHVNRLYQKSSNALLDWPNGFHKLLATSRSFRSYNETPASVYKSISHITGVIPPGAQRKWCRFILSGIESFLKRRESWSLSSY
ncbi:TniQ family protein [Pseudomonas chlororaphis]|uniref:TniQ family protein n=1 Tax=Pseudomonas chlororaphis TaxID=587753 RepID=UPI000F54E943|nr:TniQ family protein [Pseudomonas chlororaphis]AZD49494.1 hypothetical protein C4K20_4087 [Pseudomonas chlororaphis subsp. aurantiaca]AZD80616.1 hypothetical protein C4K15_4057 [Pseudomonas chlororaphis subsp. aurantiaca]AZD99990.1 hypothetical protein C4K12_4132 [Pseudomonas chlororaphis subsp. aureofaciens]AZE24591.1 hypothetical protein C4K08_4172 [Pseudomonas chlororaphis subsp. aureofaciens]WDG46283.1 TniQ family protein [Pseudomonas chlororaphis]